MSTNKKYIIRYILFTLIVILIYSCSSKSSYQLKHFIFDGVPKYEEYTPIYQDSLRNIDSLTLLSDIELINNTPISNEKVSISIHEPYKERKCSECHNMQNTKSLLISSSDLCYKCHDNLNSTYSVLHGPVASGDCLVCHSPHRAKYKNLLIKSAQSLCLNCHDLDVLGDNNEHKDINNTSCLTCHDPHGGDTNMFLVNK